ISQLKVENSSPVYAIIVDGGQGTRMGTAVPKQFLDLNGKPILHHTIDAFVQAIPGIQIVLVLPSHQISYAQMVLQSFTERIDLTIVSGGETRFRSVQNGLKDTPEDAVVMVHDGVRPLVSAELIQRCYQQALEKGSAIPAIAVTDSMRLVTKEGSEPVERSQLRIIQTPQAFRASILLSAMQQAYDEGFTDEATVVEAYGKEVFLIEGEKSNIKITTPEDMVVAEALIKARKIV
ncbi:MAG TPA: 2-C-methyl-D-erythritol 4-phosphate cytidylyltransferase, partial [Flavipsychrobacter sp.]|nr:2-C-methyl-D-erythritol 4-phosphate cytidylyltransferase [Flavipsychrobacter sp.]